MVGDLRNAADAAKPAYTLLSPADTDLGEPPERQRHARPRSQGFRSARVSPRNQNPASVADRRRSNEGTKQQSANKAAEQPITRKKFMMDGQALVELGHDGLSGFTSPEFKAYERLR